MQKFSHANFNPCQRLFLKIVRNKIKIFIFACDRISMHMGLEKKSHSCQKKGFFNQNLPIQIVVSWAGNEKKAKGFLLAKM